MFGSKSLNQPFTLPLLAGLLGGLVALGVSPANAQNFEVPITPGFDNLVGGVVAYAPDYEGSDDYEAVVGPLLSVKFWGERYFQVIGNQAFLNVLNSKTWEAGVKGVFRAGRDDDVEDSAVKLLDEVDDSMELGAFVGYRIRFDNDPRHRFNIHLDVTQDVSDGHDGFVVNLAGTYWKPLSKAFDIGLNAGMAYGSDDYMSSFFDINAAESGRSGLTQFDADSGVKDARIGVMGMFHLSEKWHIGGGLQYKRMLGDAADSPVVDDRGDANQFLFGLAAMYTW